MIAKNANTTEVNASITSKRKPEPFFFVYVSLICQGVSVNSKITNKKQIRKATGRRKEREKEKVYTFTPGRASIQSRIISEFGVEVNYDIEKLI